MNCSVARGETLILSPAGYSLQWQEWDDVYIVFQASSTETHVFNETTALILKCLERGSRSIEELKDWTEAALAVGQGDLDSDDFSFATMRLEELGLIECLDETLAVK